MAMQLRRDACVWRMRACMRVLPLGCKTPLHMRVQADAPESSRNVSTWLRLNSQHLLCITCRLSSFTSLGANGPSTSISVHRAISTHHERVSGCMRCVPIGAPTVAAGSSMSACMRLLRHLHAQRQWLGEQFVCIETLELSGGCQRLLGSSQLRHTRVPAPQA